MTSSEAKREARPTEPETTAPPPRYQQQPSHGSARDLLTRQRQQEPHAVVNVPSISQSPVPQPRQLEVSEARPPPSTHSHLQAQGGQVRRVQADSTTLQRRQRPDTAPRYTEVRLAQPARAVAGLTSKVDAAAPTRLPGGEDTQVAPPASSEIRKQAPSSDSTLGNGNVRLADARSEKGRDDIPSSSECRKSYRSGDGSTSSNATTASGGSVNNSTTTRSKTNNGGAGASVERADFAEQAPVKEGEKNLLHGAGSCSRDYGSCRSGGNAKGESCSRPSPPRVEASCHSNSDQSSRSSKNHREFTTRHQARAGCVTSKSNSAAVAAASATEREVAVGHTAGESGGRDSCWSEMEKESSGVGDAGAETPTLRFNKTKAEASSGGGAQARENSGALGGESGGLRDELHHAEEIDTSSSVVQVCESIVGKSCSRPHAVTCPTATGADLSRRGKRNPQCAININSTPSFSKAVAHGRTTQDEPDTGKITDVKRQQHRLTLPSLRAATRHGLLALEKRETKASVETTPHSTGSRKSVERHDEDRSSCLSTNSSGTTHFPERKSGMISAVAGAAAEGGSQGGARADRVREGAGRTAPAIHEEVESGGMSAREAALSAAEAFARKVRRHGWLRSASHEPLGVQGSSHREMRAEQPGEECVEARDNLTSHWLWREFFLHALHYSNKHTSKIKQPAGEKAAAAACKFGRQPRSCSREDDNMGSNGEPREAGELLHGAEGHVSPDASVLPSTAHAAFSTTSDIGAKQSARFQKTRSAEATSGVRATTAGQTPAGPYVPASAIGRTRKLVHGNASGHSVTTTILHSAVHAVKSLPYRLHREWMYLIRPRKNSAHVNHVQRMQRAADVQQDLSSAGIAPAERDKSLAVVGEPAGMSPLAAAQRGGRGVAIGARASSDSAASQQLRYVDGMPAVAGRFYPKSQRERAEELQALLHMHQVLPSRETRVRMLQQVQRNIDKGRRDFEEASPLLSLRREQLLPCGKTFIVRCLQQDSTSVTRIYRKYLTAGRLIGGGSEAMVFAAVETPLLEASPFNSRVGDIVTWRHLHTRGTAQSLRTRDAPALHVPTGTLPEPATVAPSGALNADTRSRIHAVPIWRGAHAAGDAGDAESAASGADAKDARWSRRGVIDESNLLHYRADATEQRSQKGLPGAAPPWQGTKDEAEFIEESATGEKRRGRGSSRDVGRARTLGGGSSAHQDWAICWALKWFLCEPFLLCSRSKAEQEGTVVDWLQMALWRLVPSNSINADVIYELGIVAPQWIGFVEGVSLVCPGDARFALLNRVAALPLMLGDLLTVSPVGLTVGDRLYCVMRLIQIVANLHAMGVLHNDIKMENLLIGTDGTLHLGDLGSLTPFTGRPTRFQRIGTDVYLDPQTAQNFLEYERREHDQQNQQLQDIPQTIRRGARGVTQHQAAIVVADDAARAQRRPAAGTEMAASAAGLAPMRFGAAAEGKTAGVAAVSSRDPDGRRAGARSTSNVAECEDDNIQAAKKADGDRSVGRSREGSKSPTPFRIVYTPMRDAWAVGIVCYYIWCGGLLPYNLGQAFAGELTGHELFDYLARLPRLHKGNRALFPLGSCPEGEAEEYLEIRRIIQGLLEPDGAIRKTPLEIVQQSPLFSAYKCSSLNKSKEIGT